MSYKKTYFIQGKFFLCSILLHIILILPMILYFHNANIIHDKLLHNSEKGISHNISTYLYLDQKKAYRKKTHVPIAKGYGHKLLQEHNGQANEDAMIQSNSSVIDDKLLVILHDLIAQNIRYPRGVVANTINRKTMVGFNLCPDGRIDSIEINNTSGVKILDTAALTAVQMVPQVIAATKLLNACKYFIVPVVFR